MSAQTKISYRQPLRIAWNITRWGESQKFPSLLLIRMLKGACGDDESEGVGGSITTTEDQKESVRCEKWWKECRKRPFHSLIRGEKVRKRWTVGGMFRAVMMSGRGPAAKGGNERNGKITSVTKYERRRDVRTEIGEAKQNGSVLKGNGENKRSMMERWMGEQRWHCGKKLRTKPAWVSPIEPVSEVMCSPSCSRRHELNEGSWQGWKIEGGREGGTEWKRNYCKQSQEHCGASGEGAKWGLGQKLVKRQDEESDRERWRGQLMGEGSDVTDLTCCILYLRNCLSERT